MGGKPVMAINLVNFPSKILDPGILRELLEGGMEKVTEAGAVLAGGHSVEDNEPKYGLAVTGVVHPDQVLTNAGARPGDVLILTKPIGSGVIFNANRANKFSSSLLNEILPIIAALNGPALRIAQNFNIHGLTDITGFGFAGHALEMAVHSQVKMRISFGSLPFYPGAEDMYASGINTGSNAGNRKNCAGKIEIGTSLSSKKEELLFDPQTSGGLLLSLPKSEGIELLDELKEAGIPWASLVGEIEEGSPSLVIEE